MHAHEQEIDRVDRMTKEQTMTAKVYRTLSEPDDTSEQQQLNLELARGHVHTSDQRD